MSVRALDAVNAIVLALQQIRSANGYYTNAGSRVIHGDTEIKGFEGIKLTARPAGLSSTGARHRLQAITVTIQGVLAFASATESEVAAWQLHDDILRAIPMRLPPSPSPWDAITSLEMQDTAILPREAGVPYVTVEVPLRVTLKLT